MYKMKTILRSGILNEARNWSETQHNTIVWASVWTGIREKKMWWLGRKGPSGFSASSTAEEVTQGIDATDFTAIVTG